MQYESFPHIPAAPTTTQRRGRKRDRRKENILIIFFNTAASWQFKVEGIEVVWRCVCVCVCAGVIVEGVRAD